MRTILNLFRCSHENTTWPQTVKRDREWPPELRTYIVGTECGQEFQYDWSTMRIVKEVKKAPMERKRAQVIEIGEFRRIARSNKG